MSDMDSQTFYVTEEATSEEMLNPNLTFTSNTTGIFAYSSHSLPEIVTLVLVFIFLIIWTIFGNLTVIISVRQNKQLRSAPSNILIANLALSDLLLGITVLPFSAMFDIFGYWPIGRELCFMWLITDVLLCTASIWSLLVIAVDRYTATFYPIWYRSEHQNRRTAIYIGIVWVVSTLTSVPPLFGFGSMTSDSYDEQTQPIKCVLFGNLGFVMYSSAMTFIVPATVLFVLYGKIFAELRKRSKRRMIMKAQLLTQTGLVVRENALQAGEDEEEEAEEPSTSSSNNNGPTQQTDIQRSACQVLQSTQESSSQTCASEWQPSQEMERHPDHSADEDIKLNTYQEQKASNHHNNNHRSVTQRKRDRKEKREERATKIMLTVMIIFIVCWLPFFIMYITRSVLRNVCPQCVSIPDALQGFLIWLGYINSAINPLLYTTFNKQFRTAFKTVWCQVICRRRGTANSAYQRAQSNMTLRPADSNLCTTRCLP